MTPTKEQENAIVFPGNMVIIAKPGSGKTFVIAEKIRSILPSLPSYMGVIAISYTNKASAELQKRISHDGYSIKASCLSTVDTFCAREIIFPFLSHLWGIPKTFPEMKKFSDLVDEKKNELPALQQGIMPSKYLQDNQNLLKEYFLREGIVFIESCGALALYVINKSLACQRYIKTRYSHVFIDEYQDTDQNQHELFLRLQRLGLVATAVGDISQSIFAFSGKKADFLLDLSKNPEFSSFNITYNHRSHPSIINYANLLMSSNPQLLAREKITVFEKCCDGDENSIPCWIDESLLKIMKHFEVESNFEVGILTSTNAFAQRIGRALTTKHRVVEQHPLEVRRTLTASLLCKILYYYYDASITAEEVIDYLGIVDDRRQRIAIRRILKKFKRCPSESLIDHVIELVYSIAPFTIMETDIQLLRAEVPDTLRPFFAPSAKDEVQIMTIHKAKGLEFDIVFHLDLYSWIIPFANDMNSQNMNLHYVSITRARKACFLCFSTLRHASDGRMICAKPSPFLTLPQLIAHRIRLK